MKKLPAIAVALSLAGAAANAQWAQEPSTVFGIKLGQPVAAAGLPTCPPQDRAGFYSSPPKTLCIRESSFSAGQSLDLYGTPDLTVPYKASLTLYKGRIAGLLLSLHQEDFAKLREVLIARFGKPTTTEAEDVMTVGGARLTSAILTWEGKETRLTAMERVGDITSSYVSFSDTSVAREKAAERQKAAEGAGAKF